MRKSNNQTKSKIVSAAWRLFYEQGYENTTVDEIIALSGTSKGSFYHYFDGKDALLGSLASLFDEEYELLRTQIPPQMHTVDALCFLNRELFGMIENRVDINLLTRLYSTQLTTKGEKHLDRDECIDLEWCDADELIRLISEGEIQDSKTIIGILFARQSGEI